MIGKIDVIIPTFNRLWALQKTISFYQQRPEVRNLIVINDGSTDGTGEWLECMANSDPRILHLEHSGNRGACASRNAGADIASADLVFFTDDDMYLEPSDGLLSMAKLLGTTPCDIVAPGHVIPELRLTDGLPSISPVEGKGNIQIFNKLTLELKSRARLAGQALPPVFATPLACGIMMMHREMLSNIRYDENFGITSYRDETDFQLKAFQKGLKLFVCASPVLIDLDRHNDAGGCHSLSPVKYEMQACRNNWNILCRHKTTIRDGLGIKTPILLMQAGFLIEHLVGRLGRQLAGRILRAFGLLRKPK